MKHLKFSEPIPEMILDGRVTATWRVNDEKMIGLRDVLSMRYLDGREFAQAKVVSIKITTFGQLTPEDREGHEKFHSADEMYEVFSGYYHTKVGPDTRLKIIRFKLE